MELPKEAAAKKENKTEPMTIRFTKSQRAWIERVGGKQFGKPEWSVFARWALCGIAACFMSDAELADAGMDDFAYAYFKLGEAVDSGRIRRAAGRTDREKSMAAALDSLAPRYKEIALSQTSQGEEAPTQSEAGQSRPGAAVHVGKEKQAPDRSRRQDRR